MNLKPFFDATRDSLFDGGFDQDQVDGCSTIIEEWLKRYPNGDRCEGAYILATAYHETGKTMQPVKERGGNSYFHKMYDIHGERPHVAHALGNLTPGDGVKYCGRGYPQITGRVNYQKASKIVGYDLVADPEAAMRIEFAVPIFLSGMYQGWWTGKALRHYFTPEGEDPVNARRIVNGTDCAQKIAGHYEHFYTGLDAAGIGA